MVGLKKAGVVGQEKSPEPGLFVHHQFDQVVGVGDDLIGMVNPTSIPLHQAESKNQSQRQQSHRNDWQSEKADQQTSIRGGFQKVSRGGPSTVGKQPETALASHLVILPDHLLGGQRQEPNEERQGYQP